MAYVPPHLRRADSGPPAEGGQGGAPNNGAQGRGNYGNYGAGGGEPQQQQQQQNNGPPQRGGGGSFFERDQQRREPAQFQQNSRWAGGDVRGGGDYRGGGGGYGGGRDGGRGGGRDFGGGDRGGRKNELGFYGDMRPNERLEKNLFPAKDQTQGGGGINFNNYDKIPVEMSGEDCPEPIEGFPLEVFGDA